MTETERLTEEIANAYKILIEQASVQLPVSDFNKLACYMADMGLKAYFVSAKHLGLEARANTGKDEAYGEMMGALHGFVEARLTETLRLVVPGITVKIELARPELQPTGKPRLSLVPKPPVVPPPFTPKPAS